LSLELPVAEMPKQLLGTFRISGFDDSRCSGREAPLSLELPVAGMPKWIFTFRVSEFLDAVEERDPCLLKSL
jgi:hypothetical protein